MNNHLRILIVEDNPADADLIREMLPPAGPLRFQIETAPQLSAALARLARQDIDLVLLDLGLPDSQGLPTFHALQKVAADIPVIVMTGNDDQELSLAAVRDGAQDYLVKGQISGRPFIRAVRYALARQKAAAALRQSEHKYRTLVEGIPQKVFVKDPDGRYLSANGNYARDLGLQPGDIAGKTDFDFYPKELAEKYRAEDQRILRLGKTESSDQKYLQDGRETWIHCVKTPVKNEAGEITGVLGIFSEITAQKQMEEALRKLNRALRLISLCNQEMVRATDEAALLQAICRLAVESGGYRMAWVGFAEPDEAKSVRLASQAGFVEGYLDHFNVSWADVEPGRGPTGTAIRTGKLVHASNLATHPGFAPWRAAALQRGYASSIALPLMDKDRCFGALTLYAGEPDAFDSQEIELLAELAGDLAYGIGTLRQRAERERAEAELLRRTTELAALNALSRGVSSSLSPEAVVAAALREMLNAVHPDLAFLFLREGERLELAGIAPESGRERLGQIPKHRVGKCLCGLAVRWGQPLYSRDIFNDPRCTWDECKRAGFRSFAALPLRVGDQIIGVVGLASETGRDFEQPAGFLETLANAISVSLSNAGLFVGTKRAEAALRESEARFHTLSDATFEAIAIHQSGVLLNANDQYFEMFGYARDELIGKPVLALTIAPEALPHVMKQVETGGLGPYETIGVRKDGTRFPLEIRVREREREGQHIRFGAMRDITDRKRAEEALKESRQMLLSVLDTIPVRVFWKDPGGRYLGCNQPFARDAGFDLPEQLAGKTDYDLGWKDQAELYRADDRQVIASGVPKLNYEEPQTTPTGAQLWLRTSKIPLRNTEGRIIGILGTYEDITGRKLAEEQLRQLSSAVEHSPASIVITDPAGNIEYVNPKFTAVTGYSLAEVLGKNPRILKSGETPAEEYQRMWRTIASGGEWQGEFHNRKKNGELFWESASLSSILDGSGKVAHFGRGQGGHHRIQTGAGETDGGVRLNRKIIADACDGHHRLQGVRPLRAGRREPPRGRSTGRCPGCWNRISGSSNPGANRHDPDCGGGSGEKGIAAMRGPLRQRVWPGGRLVCHFATSFRTASRTCCSFSTTSPKEKAGVPIPARAAHGKHRHPGRRHRARSQQRPDPDALLVQILKEKISDDTGQQRCWTSWNPMSSGARAWSNRC